MAADDDAKRPLDSVPFLCECDDVACVRLIRLTLPEYERVRSDGALFAVVPGHTNGAEIVDEHETYLVIRKLDLEGAVARALDPREQTV